MNDIIEISSLDDDIDITPVKPSVNFGGGLSLLMNDKKIDKSKLNDDIGLNDLEDLENDLNTLSKNVKNENNLENVEMNISNIHLDKKDNDILTSPNIDKFTSVEKYWDGFGKFNNIPIEQEVKQPKLTAEEIIREKFTILKKLEAVEKKGVKLSKRYSMDSSLNEMQGEYETIIADKERSNSCKFQGRMLMAAVTGLEFLNNKFDPFDIKLDGWAEQVNENIDDYDEIFTELHEKYKSKAKMAPELKLLFQLGGSAIMVHMTNTMFKSSLPGMDDIMRQNPEFMKQFTQAAVNSMSDTNPGFSGFMNSVMSSGSNGQYEKTMPPTNFNNGFPQSSIDTKTSKSINSNSLSNRLYINLARGGNKNDGINIQEQYVDVNNEEVMRSKPSDNLKVRPEMKGPTDINELLSGLKSKTLNTISDIEINRSQDLNEILKSKQPLKTKRRQKSEKNTVSLDI